MSKSDYTQKDDLIKALFQKTGQNAQVDNLSQFLVAPDNEKEVIWLLNPRAFRFVRCRVFYSHFRERKPSIGEGLLIGFTTLTKEAQREYNGYARRLFYIDWADMAPDSVYQKTTARPFEGVRPLSVRPGVWGKQ